MMTPLISVIIPVYNYGRYVRSAIDSVLSQTYSNIELIVINDGSTDDTDIIVSSYGDRLTYFTKSNSGLSDTRNYGIKKCHGDFILFLDADNYLEKDYLKSAYEMLRKNSNKAYVYTQLQYFDADKGQTKYPDFNLEELKKHNYIDACSLIRRSAIGNTLYDTTLPSWEDWDFYLSLAEKKEYGILLNRPFLYYRKHYDHASMLDGLDSRKKLKLLKKITFKHHRLYSLRELLRFTLWYLKQ